jgi:nitroreductase
VSLALSPDELLSTTRSVRKRLDLDRPVDRKVVEECLELALQAPTGSNRQGWHWVFVTDEIKRRAIAEHYAAGFDPYASMAAGPTYADGDVRGHRQAAVRDSATYLRRHFHQVPLMLVPCHEGRVDGADTFAQASYWGSILPAVWSFMLALRSRGLGSAWTTLHLPREREVAELLGIPFERYTQAGLLPVAHTTGTDFRRASRRPTEEIVHWESW